MSISISDATRLASQYCPFFFAVLFALVILPRAVKEFQGVCRRHNSLAADHWIFGAYFLLTFATLIGLISFATWWWADHQPIYVVSGAIHKLNAFEVTSPDPVFFKKEIDHDVNFLAYQEGKPFGNGTFEIRYRKPYDPALGTPDYDTVSVPRDGAHYDFDANFNDRTGRNELVPRESGPPPTKTKLADFSLFHDAYGAPAPQMLNQAEQRKNQTGPTPSPLLDSVRQAMMIALQGAKVYTGSEIQALDNLRRTSDADRQGFLESESTEPIIVTLLDLTRHDDHELRSKARAALKGIDVRAIFARKLADGRAHDIYLTALTRLDVKTADAILRNLIPGPNPGAEHLLRSRIESAAWVPRLLSATTSTLGDRYWLTEAWRPEDLSTANCVAKTFSSAQGADVGPDSMRGPTMRQIFSYSKKRVLDLADQIEARCPATSPSFAHG